MVRYKWGDILVFNSRTEARSGSVGHIWMCWKHLTIWTHFQCFFLFSLEFSQIWLWLKQAWRVQFKQEKCDSLSTNSVFCVRSNEAPIMSRRRTEQIAALWDYLCSGPQTPLLPWRKAFGPSPSVSLAKSRQWWWKLYEWHQIIPQSKGTILHASLFVCLSVSSLKDTKPLSDSHTPFSWCPPFPRHSLLPSVPYDWKYIRTSLKLSHSSEMCLYMIKVKNFSDEHSWMALSSALYRWVWCSPCPSFVGSSWKKKARSYDKGKEAIRKTNCERKKEMFISEIW